MILPIADGRNAKDAPLSARMPAAASVSAFVHRPDPLPLQLRRKAKPQLISSTTPWHTDGVLLRIRSAVRHQIMTPDWVRVQSPHRTLVCPR